MTVGRLGCRIAVVGALAALLMFGSAVPASALPVSLTSSELEGFSDLGYDGIAPVSALNLFGGTYATEWDDTTTGIASASAPSAATRVSQTNGKSFAAKGTIGDLFELVVKNDNASIWDFTVSINGGTASSGPISILTGSSVLFRFLLAAPLTQVSVTVGGTLPLSGGDRRAEYSLSVPDGGSTAALLGLALFGFGMLRRRFSKN